ncbi:MAG: GTP cyclohydrolase II RibA [Lautropia sp.]|nr:GTP cyclohydrolase II RibA [Lautropia sp.]
MRFQLPSPPEWRLQQASLCVDRALTELRRGRCLLIQAAGRSRWLFVAVETLTPASWQQLQQVPGRWQLFLSAQRAMSLGVPEAIVSGQMAEAMSPAVGELGRGSHDAAAPAPASRMDGVPAGEAPAAWERPGVELPFELVLDLVPAPAVETLWHWAGLDVQCEGGTPERAAGQLAAVTTSQAAWPAAAAALALARQGRLAPAVLGLALPDDLSAEPALVDWLGMVLSVDAAQVLTHARARPVRLTQVSAAPVPLADDADSRFVLFREQDSEFEHVAVVVGNPDLAADAPVRVRLHSSCLTGDLFGSLRCDCGDQLRGTVARLAASGGGIVLYLSQEGRGIGLANKLRAYVRQDQGLDTLDANQALGFRMDERHFEVAGAMLQALGCRRINLLTNNPAKIAALRAAGIEVIDREAVKGGVNPHNQRYLVTKLRRGGHLFDEDDLLSSPHHTEN